MPEKSDINVMIVLRTSTIGILDQIAPVLDQARRERNLSVMVVTEQGVPDAAEVFSTKFLDLLRHHQVLWGKDVLSALKISPERLRRQCARELVNVCYDREGLESRKEHRPKNTAMDMATAMGIELLTEEQYFELQKLGGFDTKTSSWVKTPAEMRKLGGAL